MAEVAGSGSFTAAADRLGVTRAAVSERFAALVMRLGRRLFARHHRRAEITVFGAEVADVAR